MPITRAPLFAVPASETLAERCGRLAAQLVEYECDITNHGFLDLTAIRQALEEAAEALRTS